MESFIYVKYNIKPAIEQKYFFSLFCHIQIDFPISGIYYGCYVIKYHYKIILAKKTKQKRIYHNNDMREKAVCNHICTKVQYQYMAILLIFILFVLYSFKLP